MIHVINLDRSPERWAEFQANNSHLNLQRCSAIDGLTADISAWENAGVISRDILLTYQPNELACAMSHVSLWRHGYSTGDGITMAEDDAIFHSGFKKHANEVVARLPKDWDLIVWGWNFDMFVALDLGASDCIARFEEIKTQENIAKFKSAEITPAPVRLKWCFGLPAYSVSPTGCRRLLDKALPLRPRMITAPKGSGASFFRTIGLDLSLDALYNDLQAYVCFPPLVVTKNIQGQTK